MKREDVVLTLSIVGTVACVVSMFFTASIALKANDRIAKKLEKVLRVRFSEQREEEK